MNSKIVEDAIDKVVNACPESNEFKEQFKAYLLNRLDSNYSENDLKNILALIAVDSEDL